MFLEEIDPPPSKKKRGSGMFNLEISRGGNRENKENAANSIRKSLVNRECQIKGYTQVYTHRSEIIINLNELYSPIKRQIGNWK